MENHRYLCMVLWGRAGSWRVGSGSRVGSMRLFKGHLKEGPSGLSFPSELPVVLASESRVLKPLSLVPLTPPFSSLGDQFGLKRAHSDSRELR